MEFYLYVGQEGKSNQKDKTEYLGKKSLFFSK